MKYFLFISIFFPSLVFSQSGKDEITNFLVGSNGQVSLKRGVYYSFEEFLNNEPSDTSVFTMRRQKHHADRKYCEIMLSIDTIYTFYIDKVGGNPIKTKNIIKPWGFSSGKNIYILGPHGYMKVLMVGRYLYYLNYELGDKYYQIIEYIININNGETFQLTDQVLLTILKKDPDIYNQFISEGIERKKMRYKYLLLYCEQHRNEVKVKNNLGL